MNSSRLIQYLKNKDFITVLGCILLSKSLYYESYGQNVTLIFLLLYLVIAYRSGIDLFRRAFSSIASIGGNQTTRFSFLFREPLSLIYLFNRYKGACYLFCYVFLFLMMVILNPSYKMSSFLVLVLRFMIALYVVLNLSFRTFSYYFINIMQALIILSLLSLCVIYFNIPSPLPDFIAIDGRHLKNFVFFGVWDDFIDNLILRNSGLWWEPGAFQIFINLAFMFSLINKSCSRLKYFIFMLGIISTVSTTGVMVFILLSSVFWGRLFLISQFKLFYSAMFLAISALLSIWVGPFLLLKFGLGASTHMSASFLSRYYDFIISLRLFSENWIIGYGFGNVSETIRFGQSYLSAELYSIAPPTGADGLSELIAQCGFLMFFFLWPFLCPKYYRKCEFVTKLLITASLILMFNTEKFTFTLIFSLLSLYGVIGQKQEP